MRTPVEAFLQTPSDPVDEDVLRAIRDATEHAYRFAITAVRPSVIGTVTRVDGCLPAERLDSEYLWLHLKDTGRPRLFAIIGPVDKKRDPVRVVTKLREQLLRLRDSDRGAFDAAAQDPSYPWWKWIPDLARFRILCARLADVYRIANQLSEWVGLIDSRPRDFIYVEPQRRARAAKSIHFRFSDESRNRVELQLMTLLHHGWDQIEHPHYERARDRRDRRPGDNMEALRYWAASDALLVLDEFLMGLAGDEIGPALAQWQAVLSEKFG